MTPQEKHQYIQSLRYEMGKCAGQIVMQRLA
jgi:hypothetical protein